MKTIQIVVTDKDGVILDSETIEVADNTTKLFFRSGANTNEEKLSDEGYLLIGS